MLSLQPVVPDDRPLRVLLIGAHPDDIEIGAGGTLLELGARGMPMEVDYVVLTGTPERQEEERAAARAFLPGSSVTVRLYDLPEGRFPAVWGDVKNILEDVARSASPDVILAPGTQDSHQDHRTIGEIIPTVFRNSLFLAYEIPKWDGDLSRPWLYMPLSNSTAARKVELLNEVFPSQQTRDWWDEGVFLGLARLRGMECRSEYAEAFSSTKAVVTWGSRSDREQADSDH